jgi:hypothetical protein
MYNLNYFNMKKLIALIIFAASSYVTYAQSCPPSCPSPCPPSCKPVCDKKLCRAEEAKKEGTASIATMRNDLQAVIAKISGSSLAIDRQVKDLTIEEGTSDDESLVNISKAAASVRRELLSKMESSKLVASLKDYQPSLSATKQEMVANLKKEIELLAVQADQL